MTNRREFLLQTTAASIAAAASVQACSTGDKFTRQSSGVLDRGPRITAVIRREETIRRLGGMGDNFHMSWAADDRQYFSLCDGYAWVEKPTGNFYNSRLLAIDGGPHEAIIRDVPGYPEFKPPFEANVSRYYSFG